MHYQGIEGPVSETKENVIYRVALGLTKERGDGNKMINICIASHTTEKVTIEESKGSN